MGDSLKSFDLDKYFKNYSNSLQNKYTPTSSGKKNYGSISNSETDIYDFSQTSATQSS